MGGQSRSSKYLILQVWCALLTLVVIVMAAVLISVKLTSTEKSGVSTQSQANVTPTAISFVAPLKSTGAPFSFIQLIMNSDHLSWQIDREICPCDNSSLVLRNNSIHCSRKGLYFFYAHVTFVGKAGQQGNVTLYRNARFGTTVRVLFSSVGPSERTGSVWVAKIILLRERDSVSLNISSEYLRLPGQTYWGAYQIQ